MNKAEELLAQVLKKEKEECKACKIILWVLAIIGIVAAVAGIAYAVYRFVNRDYLEDFEDEFEDDFDEMLNVKSCNLSWIVLFPYNRISFSPKITLVCLGLIF